MGNFIIARLRSRIRKREKESKRDRESNVNLVMSAVIPAAVLE